MNACEWGRPIDRGCSPITPNAHLRPNLLYYRAIYTSKIVDHQTQTLKFTSHYFNGFIQNCNNLKTKFFICVCIANQAVWLCLLHWYEYQMCCTEFQWRLNAFLLIFYSCCFSKFKHGVDITNIMFLNFNTWHFCDMFNLNSGSIQWL